MASALKCLEGIDLMHIESKPDNRGSFEFYAETGTTYLIPFSLSEDRILFGKVTCVLATLPDDDEFKEAVTKLKEFTGLDVRIMTQGDGDDNLPWFPQASFQNFMTSYW